jgi:hypothetical protein
LHHNQQKRERKRIKTLDAARAAPHDAAHDLIHAAADLAEIMSNKPVAAVSYLKLLPPECEFGN